MLAVLNPDQLVMEYLAVLRVALTGLPNADELVADVGAHIAEMRTARPDDGPAEVQAYLDRLGNPYEIAATAFRDSQPPMPPPNQVPPPTRMSPPPQQRPLPPPMPRGPSGPMETVAIVALTAGAVVAPAVGPFAGVVVASCSSAWRTSEKTWAWLLTTSSLLFGLVFAPFVLVSRSSELAGAVMFLALCGVVLGPVSAGAYLASRLSRAGRFSGSGRVSGASRPSYYSGAAHYSGTAQYSATAQYSGTGYSGTPPRHAVEEHRPSSTRTWAARPYSAQPYSVQPYPYPYPEHSGYVEPRRRPYSRY
jgi:hypothetical protein